MISKEYVKCINEITSCLIEIGLSNEQNFPNFGDNRLYISGEFDHGISLKDIDYKEIYDTLIAQRNFNLKLIDGALLQMMYFFEEDEIIKHRLCYFPSPHLLAYDENFELYNEDEIYGDMIVKNILPIPIRFDFEIDEVKYKEIEHPFSHLTLGQHNGCRIPIVSSLDPYTFITFIIRNFYSKFFSLFNEKYTGIISRSNNETISSKERTILHLNIESFTKPS